MSRLVKLFGKRKIPVFSLLLFLLPVSLPAQDRKAEYSILHNSDLKGNIQLSEHLEGGNHRIRIESTVKTSFLFNITITTIEEALFREGLLIYSLYYQKINNEEKNNWQMNWADGAYQFKGGQSSPLLPRAPIRNTILSLYCEEPVNIRQVFSDNFQQLVPVIPVEKGKYRLDLPNGNCNYYFYQQGKLTRVEVEQPFYALQFIQKS
jgi:hypothetical protein